MRAAVRLARAFAVAGCVLFGPGCGRDAAAPDRVRLVPEDSIGTLEGHFAFGMLRDAAFGRGGMLYASDGHARELIRLEPGSGARIVMGRRGAGPGEYESPTHVTRAGDRIAVYDEGEGSVSVFTPDGSFVRRWPVEIALVEDMEASDSLVAVSSGLEGRTRLIVYDWSGEIVADTAFGSDGGRPVRAGHVCFAPDGAMFRLERSGRMIHRRPPAGAHAADSTATGLDWVDDTGSALILGLECDESWIVAALLNPGLTGVRYLVFRREPLALVGVEDFERTEDGVVHGPGFLVDMRGDSLLALTSRPYPKLRILRITSD